VGYGAGFAVTLLLAVASYGWWSSRPKQWSNTAVTAKPTELSFQRQREEIRFRFRYALTNNTDIEYILATPSSAALMRKLPEDSSLAKVAATWDDNVRIPPRQAVNATFEVTIKFSDYNMTAAKLHEEEWVPGSAAEPKDSPEFMKFAGKRLAEMNGFALLDYSEKYRIDLPKNWNKIDF
jgi:hypothetical protein